MHRALTALVLTWACASGVGAQQTGQPGALTSQRERLQTEILISNLPKDDLTREIMAEKGNIDHHSEVGRGGPVAAVVRTTGCQQENGACKVNADVVVYRPDGSLFHEAKNLDLPQGRAAIPLTIDEQSPIGVYRVVVVVRDLTARRFARVERQFGVR